MENRTTHCPDCGADMIDDAFENITIMENGDIQMDIIYPAWVCRNYCGYCEKLADEEGIV